jgi:hypothetical protein
MRQSGEVPVTNMVGLAPPPAGGDISHVAVEHRDADWSDKYEKLEPGVSGVLRGFSGLKLLMSGEFLNQFLLTHLVV